MKRVVLLLPLFLLFTAGNCAAEDSSVIFLADIHFDTLEHHDFSWLESNKPNDIRQITNYSRITRENLPLLMNAIRTVSGQAVPPVSYVLQSGDFSEGLCGSYRLAKQQLSEFTAFIDSARLGAPLCVVQGNHDITGPGSAEAYADIIHPWLHKQVGVTPNNGCYSFSQGDILFLMYNGYDDGSLDWLELTIQNSDKHEFVVICHEPVVPFQAQSNWTQFIDESEKDDRTRLLNILGQAHATVLCGHLHKFGIVARKTDKGTFVQIAINSVLSDAAATTRDYLLGTDSYTAALTELEPSFSPETIDLRKKILEAEKPYISYFEFADMYGFARLIFSDDTVTAQIHAGTDIHPWRTINLSELKRPE